MSFKKLFIRQLIGTENFILGLMLYNVVLMILRALRKNENYFIDGVFELDSQIFSDKRGSFLSCFKDNDSFFKNIWPVEMFVKSTYLVPQKRVNMIALSNRALMNVK